MSIIVQYIIIRSDLHSVLKWPLGALIAQACHATMSCFAEFKEDEVAKAYLSDVKNMHKVVLAAKNEDELVKLAEKLKEHQIAHSLWIENPEDIPTCIAVKPYAKEHVQEYFKHLKLYK